MKNTDIQKQKSEWKRKGWSIPEYVVENKNGLILSLN